MRTTLLAILAACPVLAAYQTYSTPAAFQAAAGPVRTVDFSTRDDGSPVTSGPVHDVYWGYLGLRGLCFENVRSYYNLSLYNRPLHEMKVNLPPGVRAFSVRMFSFNGYVGNFVVRLSTGETVTVPRGADFYWIATFLGVVTDTPISWATFHFETDWMMLDDFSVPAGTGSLSGCPAPADTAGPETAAASLSPNPVAVNTGVTLSASVSDAATGGSLVAGASYAIDHGPWQPMAGPSNQVTAAFSAALPPFAAAGVRVICVRGTDAYGNTGAPECTYLAVYDPNGGFVTGGGSILSPPGADGIDPAASGPARFGFVSKYLPGANTPSGNLEFHFKAGGLAFKSTAMDVLVVTGEPRAIFRGKGLVNGGVECKFEVDAWDGSAQPGDVDAFGIKIHACQAGPDSRYSIPARPLASGNIAIHR